MLFVLYILKQLLFNHLIPLLVLIEIIILGYSVGSSNNMGQFIKSVTYWNQKYLGIIAGVITWIVTIFYRIIQALKPI